MPGITVCAGATTAAELGKVASTAQPLTRSGVADKKRIENRLLGENLIS
jgi:hypothetical protein